MDLHRVAFPTFVLEPRSMLERIADFMSHPDLVFGYVHVPIAALVLCLTEIVPLPWAEKIDDPEEHFLAVLPYYLSRWHIKPKGVKKLSVHDTY